MKTGMIKGFCFTSLGLLACPADLLAVSMPNRPDDLSAVALAKAESKVDALAPH